MTIKLNSFTLSDNAIREMKRLSGKANTTENEHGFNLCTKLSGTDNKIIKPGKLCEGEKCSMNTSTFMCEENERTVGTFHTHKTLSNLNPSISDLSVGYLVGISCIGNPEEIKCFNRKKDFDGLAFADIKSAKHLEEQAKYHHSRWKNKEISDREYRNIYSKYKKEVDRIIDNHFEVTAIK